MVNLIIPTIAIGLLWAIMALGVYIPLSYFGRPVFLSE